MSNSEQQPATCGCRVDAATYRLAVEQILRRIAGGEIPAGEAVRVYEAVIAALGAAQPSSLAPPLKTPLSAPNALGPITGAAPTASSSCGCGGSAKAEPAAAPQGKSSCSCGCGGKPAATPKTPDFAKMTQVEKLRYNQAKRDALWGRF